MDMDLDARLSALSLLHQRIVDELPDHLKNGRDRQTTASWARDEIIRLHQKVSDLQRENAAYKKLWSVSNEFDQMNSDEWSKECERLRQQVAELVEALNNFACTCPYVGGCSLSECGSVARDAITKATGGK